MSRRAELESDPELRTLTQRIWATNWSHTLDFVLSGNHRLSPEDREFLHEQLQARAASFPQATWRFSA